MPRRRKISLAACVTLVVIAVLLWRRTNGPIYEGRTVEQWFKLYHVSRDYTSPEHLKPDPDELKLVESAFRGMGTNAVPFLAGRITRDLSYSKLYLWRFKYRRKIPQSLSDLLPMPVSKFGEASSAANVLSALTRPPGAMLIPLLEPALQSTNAGQRLIAIIALRGISSGYELARPHLMRGFNDSDGQVQQYAADAAGMFGPHAKWAVSNLLELVGSPTQGVHEASLHGLNRLGTNSWPVLPRLKEMLASETDEGRKKRIAHAIQYISESGPSELRKD